jgi:Tfp pilus assembly protein PilE
VLRWRQHSAYIKGKYINTRIIKVGKLQKDETGFSAVEVVLVLVIVALIAIVGYMVYHNHHKTTTAAVSTTAAQTSTPKSTKTANPYTGWGTYTDTSGWFTLKYPTEWSDNTVKAGTTVSEGPNQTPTKLTANAQGNLSPTVINGQIGTGLLSVSTDTYTGTVQAYLAKNGAATQNKDLTINGYQAHFGVGTNNGGDTYRTYEVFNNGKVAILNFLVSTPTSFDGTVGKDYSQYSSVEDQIANSLHFAN